MYVNTMPRLKDISSNLSETIVAAHQSEKGYEGRFQTIQTEIHHAAVTEMFQKKNIQEPDHRDCRLCLAC